eukprot:gb/GECG01008220.1/.p1 GENE.gb/GECG01008220.1/~~gb/GECG01008220.1/.p1  ORF type:complete len:1009 (+),score=93.70 gb/GECG01008220.1/:1-3027(+)
MPQLTCGRKRWGISADDFVCPGFATAVVRFVSLAMLVPLTIQAATHDCRTGIRVFLYLTVSLYSMAFINDVALVRYSTRGTLIEIEKRRGVGRLAILETIFTVLHFGCAIFGLYAVFEGSPDECTDILKESHYERSLEAFAFLNVIIGVFFACSFGTLCLFRGNATWIAASEDWHAEWNDSIFVGGVNQPPGPAGGFEAHREHTWTQRCGKLSRMLCCCRTALTGDSQETFEILGRVMSVVLRSVEALHLTVSDIVTGLMLLRVIQKRDEIECNAHLLALQYGEDSEAASKPYPSTPETDIALHVTPIYTSFTSSQGKTGEAKDLGGALRGIGSRINAFHFQMNPSSIPIDLCSRVEDSTGRREILELWHYGKFALAPYGWMLYLFSNLGTGMCKLCTGCVYERTCETKLKNGDAPRVQRQEDTCCRSHPNAHEDCCGCNTAAARLQVEQNFRSDLLYVSWRSKWYKPAVAVFYDRVKESLVIAIRGTLSLDDCITDAVAIPVCANESRGLQEYARYCFGRSHQDGYAEEDLHAAKALARSPSGQERMESAEKRFQEQDSYYIDSRCDVDDWYVHGGILRSARAILAELCHVGILTENTSNHPEQRYSLGPLIPENVKTSICRSTTGTGESKDPDDAIFDEEKARIAIVGHSLGAGVSTVLTPFLAPSFPSLKCYAYSAPGATVSPSFSVALRPFVTTVVLGKDMVPRLGFPNLRRLFYKMLVAYSSADLSKGSLIRYGCQSCWSSVFCGRRSRQTENSTHSRILNAMRQSLINPMDPNDGQISSTDSLTNSYVPGSSINVEDTSLSIGGTSASEPLNDFKDFAAHVKTVLRAERHRLRISQEKQLSRRNSRKRNTVNRSVVSESAKHAARGKGGQKPKRKGSQKAGSFESVAAMADELWQPDDADRIMWVGGKVIHLSKLRTWSRHPLQGKGLSTCLSKKFTEFIGSWSHPADFGDVYVSNLMVKDHLPDNLVDTLNSMVDTAELVNEQLRERNLPEGDIEAQRFTE